MTASDDEARQAALDFTRRIAGSWRARPGPRLLGTYLIGSLAHGGFNRRYSDIDMAVVTETPLDDAQLDDMRRQGSAISPGLAAKLSIFWADRDFSTGRFPPLDRVDYLDHAVALMEVERANPARPSIDEIRAYLRGAPFESWATGARELADLDTLEPENHKPYLRALLYPARFVYSWSTGRMASNDEAVAFVGERRPPGLDVELIARAFDCRCEARDPDGLFVERGALPSQVEACRRLISLD